MGLRHLDDEALKEYFRRVGTVSRWWDPEGGPFAYHFRSEFKVLAEFPRPAAGSRVLDVGAGRGLFTIWFARQGCQVDAVDISAEMLAVARRNVAAAGVADRVTFHEGDAEDLSRFPEGGYDWVSCMHTFDHIPDLPKGLGSMTARLEKGGSLLFTYCPEEALHGILFRFYARFASRFVRLGMEEKLVARLYRFSRIAELLEGRGIALERMAGVGLTCMFFRPEFERGLLTRLTRGISRLEERLWPFYRSPFLARRCQVFLGLGRRR